MKLNPKRQACALIVAGIQVLLAAFVQAASPPTADLVAWFKADSGVATSDGVKVTAWADQAGGTHNATTGVGSPQLSTHSFANGSHPVIRFDGASGLFLANPKDFDLSTVSIYIVGGVDSSVASQIFVAHWEGWAFGISDGVPGRIKWVSNGPFDSFEPNPGGNLANNVPYRLTGTYAAGGEKKFYRDGSLVGSKPFGGVSFRADNVAIGMLFKAGAQFLRGFIGEILIYRTVSDKQRAAVDAYLVEKYVAPRPPLANLKMWLRADQGVVTTDGVTVQTWEDQGGNVLNNGNAQGSPVLTSTVFPNGTRPTISLDGASSFECENVNDLDIPEISIYVVAAVDSTAAGGSFLSNLREPFGFSLEVGDGGTLNFYTGLPVVAGTDNLSGGVLDNNVPALITGTFQKDAVGDIKTIYVDGAQRARIVGAGLNNATGNKLRVGARGGKSLTGQIAEILAYSSVSPQQQQEVELYLRTKYFGSDTGPVVIRAHPVAREVAELKSVTFSVVAEGAPPLTYQWRRNGVDIPGAIQAVYTIPEVRRAQAGAYSVVVANGIGPAKTSDSAALTVIPDDTKPTLLSVDRDFTITTRVNVSFSERVSAATAIVKGNYSIQPGVTVDSAQLGADGKTVVLTTSPITPGTYTLTVNNIQDIVGNPILANSQGTLEVENSLVPTKNLKLWLRADAGVVANDGVNVERWEDQAPGIKNNGVPFVPAGPPQLGTMEFPTGPRPVILFGANAGSGFRNENAADLRDTEMTIYLIGSISEMVTSRIFIANYVDVAGWGLGISDGTGGRIKWFTAPPNSMEPAGAAPAGADLELNVPYMITADYSRLNGGTKHMYLASKSFPSTELLDPNVAATDVTLGYAGNTVLTVGGPSNTGQRLRGTIAEVLVYASVDANQRKAVQNYLSRKYFAGGSGPPVITFQPQSKTVSEFSSVTFEVSVDGASPFLFKWFKNGVEIPGAVGSSYTLSSATRQDAGSYTVLIENPAGSKLSDAAVLTLRDLDTTPPTLVSAKQNSSDTSAILVSFSERLNPASAASSANYAINGVTVTSAAIGASPDSVVLTTSRSLVAGQAYTLRVSGVADRVGNLIVANSSIAIKVFTPFTGTPPPSADLLAWFSADVGITTSDFSKVTSWADRAGGTHNATTSQGTPVLTDRSFPSGDRPVIAFDGASGLFLENPQDFDLATLSIYVVGGVDSSVASQIFTAHWPGWAFGISDGVGGRIKWVSNGPFESFEPSNLANLEPHLLTGTYVEGGDKKFYVNGSLGGSKPFGGVTFSAQDVTIGMLSKGGGQFLRGYIAEILIYNSVSDGQRAKVEGYLRAKYVPDRTPPAVVRARSSSNGTQVQVSFSEPLLADGANLAANYTISGGATVTTAALQADGKTVLLTTASGVTEGAVLTVSGVADAAGNVIAPNSQIAIDTPARRVQDGGADGLLVLEAENADRNNPAGGSVWDFTIAAAGFSGRGAMVPAPDAGRNVNIDISASPRLDFDVRFAKTGTHYIWVRGLGDSAPGPSANDSVNVGIDGRLPDTSDRITGFTDGAGFVWTRSTADTLPAQLDVSSAGPHVISIWMREDGLIVDKLLLTTNPNFVPEGLGPAESGKDGIRLSISRTATGIQISWGGTAGTLQSAPSVNGPWTAAASQANPQTIPLVNLNPRTATFYRLR